MSTAGHAAGSVLRAARERKHVGVSWIAERAGVGESWYGALEAGRDVALTSTSLAWVCDALDLGDRERARAFEAADLHDRRLAAIARLEHTTETLTAVLTSLKSLPAYVVGGRLDLLAWNEAADAIYRCESLPSHRRNVLMFLFALPEARRVIVDWEDEARRTVEFFRPTAMSEPWHASLVEQLEAESADFRRMWKSPADATATRTKTFTRRGHGKFSFYTSAGTFEHGLRLHVYAPLDTRSETALARLVLAHRQRRQHGSFLRNARALQRIREYIDETTGVPARAPSPSAVTARSSFARSRE